MRWIQVLGLMTFLIYSIFYANGAEIIRVPSDANTIQEAIRMAYSHPGTEIVLDDGVYSGQQNCNLSISKSVTIRSKNGPENCIIDCNHLSPFIDLTSTAAYAYKTGVLTLDGLTIRNGKNTRGGAISVTNRQLIIKNSVLSNNTADNGGAIAVYSGGDLDSYKSQVEIFNSRLEGNTADSGGAIFCRGMSCISVVDSVFVDNSATSTNQYDVGGGAINSDSGSMVVLINSRFISNSAHLYGGAIKYGGRDFQSSNSRGYLTIQRCVISDNMLDDSDSDSFETIGAGVYIGGSYSSPVSVNISNSEISRNVAVGNHRVSGGGLAFYLESMSRNSRFTIKDCTINDNIIKGSGEARQPQGAGISIDSPHNDELFLLFSNCVISGNSAGDPKNSYEGSRGGGIACRGNQPIFIKCRITNNRSGLASGMFFDSSSPIVSNCIISGNICTPNSYTGCIELWGSEYNSNIEISNSTIVGNSSWAIRSFGPKVKINNTILWDNNPHKQQLEGVFDITYSCIQNSMVGFGNIESDPCFVEPGYWDINEEGDYRWVEGNYHLKAGSKCIDAGGYMQFFMDSTDIDDKPRFINSRIDIGAYEYQNRVPLAVAGEDQVVYANFDGIAEVNLDGSGSCDNDNDALTYKWKWIVEGDKYESDEAMPVIWLPIGTHIIELIVNDGQEDSELSFCTIEVIGPVRGELVVMPFVLNCKSQNRSLSAILYLPDAIKIEDIAEMAVTMFPGNAKSIYCKPVYLGYIKKTALFAVFHKDNLCQAVDSNSSVRIYVSGKLISGRYFYGKSNIQVFKKNIF